MDYGFQLGRRFRALKLWFVIRYFGREGIAARLRNHCRLARDFADWIRQSENFELMAPTPFALVCFRAVPKHLAETQDESGLDEFNERLMNKINASGKAYLSHTKLKGRLALRFSVGSIRIMPRHIEEMKELLTGAVAEIGLSMQ